MKKLGSWSMALYYEDFVEQIEGAWVLESGV